MTSEIEFTVTEKTAVCPSRVPSYSSGKVTEISLVSPTFIPIIPDSNSSRKVSDPSSRS